MAPSPWLGWSKPPQWRKTARAEATNDALRSQMKSVAGETELFWLCEDELGRVAARPSLRPVLQVVEEAQLGAALLCQLMQHEKFGFKLGSNGLADKIKDALE